MNEAEREAFDAWWKLDAEGSENKAAAYEGWKARAAYAQGGPANQREAFRAWCESIGYSAALMTCGDLAAFKAGAAWQRTQAAGVPDVSAMARVLSDRSADACNIDRTDNWAMYGQEYIEDVQAMFVELRTLLAAAPQPAPQQSDEVRRLREALERATKLLSAAAGYATKMEPMPAKLLNAIDAELDASTGQEVES